MTVFAMLLTAVSAHCCIVLVYTLCKT